MGFMVLAGIRLDSAVATLWLPDEVRIGLAGRKPLYRSTIQEINLNDQHVVIPVGKPTEVRIEVAPPRAKLLVRRDVEWTPTVINEPVRINYLHLTNICDREVILRWGTLLGLFIIAVMIPRSLWGRDVKTHGRHYRLRLQLIGKTFHPKHMKDRWLISDHIPRLERF